MPASTATVDVGAMFDDLGDDPACFIVDSVENPMVSSPSAVVPLELEAQQATDPPWLGDKRAVDELDRCRRDLLRKPR